jgi:predicted SAM-dependent methyltransferase
MKLNIGCGKTKNKDYINIDADPNVKPDKVLDVSSMLLPYADESVEEVTMFHTVEHLRKEAYPVVFGEINRVLCPFGNLLVSYPDARIILQNYLDNAKGMRDYWEATIYGRGQTIWDRHQSLVLTVNFVFFLREHGFGNIVVMEEADQPHNTVVHAQKIFKVVEMTQLLKKELNL